MGVGGTRFLWSLKMKFPRLGAEWEETEYKVSEERRQAGGGERDEEGGVDPIHVLGCRTGPELACSVALREHSSLQSPAL